VKPFFRLILTIILAVAIVLIAVFAVENRAAVTMDLWPLPWIAHPPLYLPVLGAAAIGLIVGAGLCGIGRLRLWRRARASESRAERLVRAAAAQRPAIAVPPSPSGTPPSATAAPPGRALSPRERAAVDDN
jgi:uncharacterized integral membrane protein